MSTQIFKKNVPNEIIFSLLEKICLKHDNYYILNIDSFKKGMYKEIIQTFIRNCYDYYHISKRKYLDTKLTFNSFTTIIRQICNFNKIAYTSQIKYDKSSYIIVYYIHFHF
jgi:hypothetical protein